MQRSLLIVCDAFPPDFAPRIGNLCKYLDKEYTITIVTEDHGQSLWPVEIERDRLNVIKVKMFTGNKAIDFLIKIADYIFSYRDIKLYNEVIGQIKETHFDVILCASYYIFPLLCAKRISRRLSVPLCIDLRDIMEQNAKPKGWENFTQFFKLRWLNQVRRNRILSSANIVTTVSPWHVQTLMKHHDDVRLIYNGFDSEKFCFSPIPTEKFTITYTGRLLENSLRNPTLFFESITELCSDKKFKGNLLIQWYVDKASIEQIKGMTEQYGLTGQTKISSTVSSCLMPEILNKSSIVLVISNKSTDNGPHGIMTTKFFEALGCEKPTLCIPSDEECLESTIVATNAGLSARDKHEACKFIMAKYREWESNGYTHQLVRNKKNFTRQNQAVQFKNIFEELSSLVDNKPKATTD